MRKSNVAFGLKYSCKVYERDQIAPSCFVHKPLTAKSRKSTQTHFSDGTFAEHPSSKHRVKLIFINAEVHAARTGHCGNCVLWRSMPLLALELWSLPTLSRAVSAACALLLYAILPAMLKPTAVRW